MQRKKKYFTFRRIMYILLYLAHIIGVEIILSFGMQDIWDELMSKVDNKDSKDKEKNEKI